MSVRLVNLKKQKLIIHLCDWSSQPDIHIYCDDSWTGPAWGPIEKIIIQPGVYLSDDDRLYCFDAKLVSCKACLDKMKK